MNEQDFEKLIISNEPPMTEPERQWYFIAKCREIIKVKSEQAGRPLTFCIQTFGCPKVNATVICANR